MSESRQDTEVERNILAQVDQIEAKLVAWRRDLHRHPESGWTEFRTSALIANELSGLGFDVTLGRDLLQGGTRLGVPSDATLRDAHERALREGAPADLLSTMEGGYTGVVGRLRGAKPGPVIGFRLDIDALEVDESDDPDHAPRAGNYRSTHPGLMHTCGHDGHTAMGLGLAHVVAACRSSWPGEVVLVFQPAEEGTRGGQAMADAGVVDDCRALLCFHLGTESRETGHVIGGASRLFATRKLDATFEGRESHAALEPEAGRSALLGAATAALGVHAISRHSDGSSRINAGVLQAGSARNVTPRHATLKLEVRGATNAVLGYLEERVRAVVSGAAEMHDLDHRIETVGTSPSVASDPRVIECLRAAAADIEAVGRFDDDVVFRASDDAAALMQRVQSLGGIACYSVIGAKLGAGHHMPRFDFDERALGIGVKLLALGGWRLAHDLDPSA